MSGERGRNNDMELLLDRLVDGELDDNERRELLLWMDEHPEWWRRCALTFLESRAWHESIGDMVEEWRRNPRPDHVPASSEENKSSWIAVAALFGVAASVLLAFGLGWSASRYLGESPVAQNVPRYETSGPSPSALTSAEGQENGGGPGRVATEEANAFQPVGTLVWSSTDGERPGEDGVPILPSHQLSRWVVDASNPVPNDIRAALRRLGFQVRQQRRWATIDVSGDQRVMLPVEQVEIVPVSRVQ